MMFSALSGSVVNTFVKLFLVKVTTASTPTSPLPLS
ncbi:hypothetical protein [Sulfolobus polyhedral virus 3]|nr:hypothetical protein [Sulfolobus polyhedral virus 3]